MYAPCFRREPFLDLLNDGRVAGIPLRFARVAPIPHKLLNGGLQLVHVEGGRWPGSPHVVLQTGKKKKKGA